MLSSPFSRIVSMLFKTPIAHCCKNFPSHCQVVFAGLGLDEDHRAAVRSVVH